MTEVDNVVLITVDSLRADRVPSGDRGLTPALDGLAHEGAVFEQAFAQGNWTPFSFPGILASRPVFAESADIGLPDTPTLAEVLSEAGITTGGFNAANGFLTEHWGYDRGFDAFESFITGSTFGRYGRYLAAHPTIQGWWHLLASPFRRAGAFLRRKPLDRPFADVSKLTKVEEHARTFLTEREGRRFLWVHYMDAHTPYVPAPRELRKVSTQSLSVLRMLLTHARTGLGREVDDAALADLETLYDATLAQVDASVGRLLETIETEVPGKTAIVVAGDHGEEFMEHGHLSHYPKLYRELIHVPLIVAHPEGDDCAVSEPVGLDVIPPTICDLLGVDRPAGWDGHSVAPATVGSSSPAAEPVVSVTVRGSSVTSQPIPRRLDEGELLASARTGRWTYIKHTESGMRELYDRSTDPGETDDLFDTDADPPSDVVAELETAIDSHVATLGGESGGERPPDAVADQLEALGYR